jgi:D-threo-aldose 1-dehydrogenase
VNEILEKRRIGSTDVFVTELGMGGAPLGRVSPENASESLRESFNQGIRYFDTAPLYGTGTSEKFFGKFLSKLDRQSFVLSTKVGRLIKDTGNEVNITFNYKRDEILRSIEESLKRLDMDSIDIALIHDPDDHYDLALNEAFPTLDKLRSEGVIKAIGAGMNQWEMLADFARNADFDCFLVAGRYTLLDHTALNELMPLCLERGISLILGGPYNSGVLASDLGSDTTYFYDPAPKSIIDRAKKIKEICDIFDVPLKAAAIQFGLLHPSVASTIPGPRNSDEVQDNIEMLNVKIPSELWKELKRQDLIHQSCPES